MGQITVRDVEIDSQIVKIKNRTLIVEIIDPIEDTIFHGVNASG